MSSILPDLTFYRLPDTNVPAATFSGLLTGVYNSLTSSVDYRGNSIPSTHLWTWATGAVGVTNAVYNTSIPTGSGLTRNFAVLFAASSSAAPTMASPDTFLANTVLVGINTDTGSYSAFTNAIPMTNGTFTGFWRSTNTSLNVTGTICRAYVSQESIFIKLFLSTSFQVFIYAGAIYEPYVTYNSGSNFAACQADNRILGIMTLGNQNLDTTFLSATNTNAFGFNNVTNGQSHVGYLRPYFNTFAQAQRLFTYSYVTAGGEKDISNNWIFDTIPYYDAYQQSIFRVGHSRNLYVLGLHQANTTTIRSGSTDLYHLLSHNSASSTQTIALKAAP